MQSPYPAGGRGETWKPLQFRDAAPVEDLGSIVLRGVDDVLEESRRPDSNRGPLHYEGKKGCPFGSVEGQLGAAKSCTLPVLGGPLGTGEDPDGHGDVRREYVEDDEEDLARDANDPRSQRGPSNGSSTQPGVPGNEPSG
jgi:hypothetical protein